MKQEYTFSIVDAPDAITGHGSSNRGITALIGLMATLPEGKAIPVSPEMFGWGCKKSSFVPQLRMALKSRKYDARVIERDGAVFVIPSGKEKV